MEDIDKCLLTGVIVCLVMILISLGSCSIGRHEAYSNGYAQGQQDLTRRCMDAGVGRWVCDRDGRPEWEFIKGR